MTQERLLAELRTALSVNPPFPGSGQTSLRHKILMETGRNSVSVARLAEAHWDAVAILAEAGRVAKPGAIYGVWASEKPGQSLQLEKQGTVLLVSGTKMFCSGAGLIDQALVTVQDPKPLLLDVDLRSDPATVEFDDSGWKTDAFQETRTAAATFKKAPASEEDIIGGEGWYLSRPGFWHGACGPAACWAGGAIGLVDFAVRQSRHDPHTLAHLGAMHASAWAMQAYLDCAGREIDANPENVVAARMRALTVRHLVEQASTDILRRLVRAYGPYPLAMDEEISRRYKEVDLYLRQSHAERDLEALGRDFRETSG